MMFSLFCIVILSYSPVAPVKTRKKAIIRCYSKSSGNEKDVEIWLSYNLLAAGARLETENGIQAHDKKTSRT